MAIIKAIAQIQDFTAGDTGLGVDYDLDIVENTWRDYIELDTELYYLYPNDDSVTTEMLWYNVAYHAAQNINKALTDAAFVGATAPTPWPLTALSTLGSPCTPDDVFVPGFGDHKMGKPADVQQDIWQGDRMRTRRIPRNSGSIVQIRNAQATVDLKHPTLKYLRCTIQFHSGQTPTLGTQLEYKLFLYPATGYDLTTNGSDSFVVDTVSTGPPYTLSGSKLISTLAGGLDNDDRIHVLLGLRRKATGSNVAASDAGTIDTVVVSLSSS